MRKKGEVRTEAFDPLQMRRDYKALVTEADELALSHDAFMVTLTPAATPRTAEARAGAARLAQYSESLRRAWESVERVGGEATDALRALLRMLPPVNFMPKVEGIAERRPMPATNVDPLEDSNRDLRAIPLAATRVNWPAPTEEEKPDGRRMESSDSVFDRDTKLRGLALTAETKVQAFKLTIERYTAAKQMRRTSSDVRNALRAVGSLDTEDVDREPPKAERPELTEAPPVVFDFAAEAGLTDATHDDHVEE
jgi:hypothetical protein